MALERSQHEGRRCVVDARHLEGRDRGAWVEQIRMVAHLAQLHEDVDDTHKVSRRQGLLRPARHTSVNYLILIWPLCLDSDNDCTCFDKKKLIIVSLKYVAK